MSGAIELVGEFERERAVFPMGCDDSDEDRTIIGALRDGTVIKGKAFGGSLERGMTYLFTGRWMRHDKYGDQFLFDAFARSAPSSREGTIVYLSKCTGIGGGIARAMWDAFGSDAVRMLREEPQEVAGKLTGVKLPVSTAILASGQLRDWQATEQVTIALNGLLAGKGFPRTVITEAIGEWGAAAEDKIRSNPFLLMRFQGVGFQRADTLYRELKLPLHAMERQGYAAAYSVDQNRSGSTWVTRDEAVRGLRSCVGGIADIDGAFAWAIEHNLLRERTDKDGAQWVALAKNAKDETLLAGYLHRAEQEIHGEMGLLDPSKVHWPDPDTIADLSEHQREQLKLALRGRIGILSGGPGTGKTYTLARLLDACRQRGMGRVSLVAPTGKAAVRMTEALIESGYNVSIDQRGRTIASVVMGSDSLGPVTVADESSMDDTSLMASLLSMRHFGSHVLFVGDIDQLPPVGHGAPLRDMMASGIPAGHLTEPHRNAGRIVLACKEIRERQTLTPSPRIDLQAESPENLWVEPCKTPAAQVAAIREWLTNPSRIRSVWPEYGGDAVWGCQVIVPLNDKSEVSRKKLNQILQGDLNPKGEPISGTKFRLGDKIINGTNSWLTPGPGCPADQISKSRGVYVANGEQGTIVDAIADKALIIRLDTPERIVRVPRKKDGGIGDWDLGYAISCHRSQGSAWDVVFVIIDESGGAKRLCDRHWWLTGISRARQLSVLIGKLSTAQDMVRKSNMWERKTFLREKLEHLRDIVPDRPVREKVTPRTGSPVTERAGRKHLRCEKCHQKLTAPMVHVLDGLPYGPTCINRVDPHGHAKTVPLLEWLKGTSKPEAKHAAEA